MDSARGAFFAMASEALGRIAVMVFQWRVALLLGPSLYGTLGLALASAATLLPLADMGLQSAALRNLSNTKGGNAFSAVLPLRLWGSIVYLIALPILGLVMAKQGVSLHTMLLAGSYYLALSLSDFFRQSFRALELARPEFIARLSYLPAVAGSLVLVQIVPPSVSAVLLIYCLAPLLLAAVYLAMLLRQGIAPGLDTAAAKSLLRSEWKGMAQSMLLLASIALVMRVDLWILDARINRAAVGFYLAGYNMVFAGAFLAQASASQFYPYLSRSGKPRSERMTKVFLAQFSLAICLFFGVFLFGPVVFGKIYHRPGFSEAIPCLVWFGASLAIASMNVLWSNILLMKNHQGLYALALLGQVAVKIAIAPYFLGRWGTSGMAMSSFVIDLPFCIVMGVFAVNGYLKGDEKRSSGLAAN
ncbi:MAG: oligosaccharide flippase family protein [Fibrobacterota bacterium]|nr:oligosaccharide flippase family protein [Fibrobacterota bacterium]QQS06212.1 MAG: oligosaccharide flippase family protein [Fibrobacterota bacterium]